ncbi:Adaptin ear-binding coat-associated protein 2 [Colletotrichum spinosum]|uniref:Adaptin ear-binding coat-associated protein 2 n=1 Tax=Colletotrichum spinosum TaxID=1347390 RepID=A0A4R8Q217_9PEZI|nr:Adaptin ear-binding coat-associated protein 2 [Colletotrichum spinosum]
MASTDPTTGAALPPDAIQRILFIAPAVHVYNIPPLASNKGYTAAGWTTRQIFTARLRVLESAWESAPPTVPVPVGVGSAVVPAPPVLPAASKENHIKVDIILEDPSNGQLFAAAPYTALAAVEPVPDSSRFFAVRVQDGQGRKAVLGIGFEERSEAFDFGVALQEAQKSLGLLDANQAKKAAENSKRAEEDKTKDYSLKEGETITINFGGSKIGRRSRPSDASQTTPPSGAGLQGFALPPPPGGGGGGGGGSFLPPPPSASAVRDQKREKRKSAQDLGFDDGQFGEFA